MYKKIPFLPSLQSLSETRRAIFPAVAPPWAWWEWPLLIGMVVTALGLGLANLGVPSLWHDELVHIYVAKGIVAHGWPTLPSGNFYPSSTAYNVLLAIFVALFGDEATWVRLPSVLLSGLNVGVVYFLTRQLLGRNVALVAALSLALSPWHLAWARQARLYEFQLLVYLVFIYAAWRWSEVGPPSRRWGLAAIASYVVGVLTSFHSILFLGPVGAYAILIAVRDRRWKSPHMATILSCTVLGLLSILWFRVNPNPVDRAAVFDTGIGGLLLDYLRTDRYLYFRFLCNNLSTGFFLLAVFGTVLLAFSRDRKSMYIALAFWVPVLVLTFLVGYRRPRFMYFAYPFYVILSSVGLVGAMTLLWHARKSWLHIAWAVIAALFLARLSLSALDLVKNSLETASGANITLAVRHPQWIKPTRWIRENRTDETLLTTTFLPVYHYVGHVDNWFPNRYTLWEYQESGMEGLGSLDELRAFLREHPKGYFIAEKSRFMMWRWHGDLVNDLGKEVTWVESNMTKIEAASSDDVWLWSWDFTTGVPE